MTSHLRHPVGPGGSGGPRSPRTRVVLRVLGGLLLLGGVFLVVAGGSDFLDDATSEAMNSDPGFGPLLTLAAGAFLVVFGIGALSAGFLGAQASYAARETAPAVQEVGSALRGDAGSGPSCTSCGARAGRDARFCDACGHELARR